MKNLIALVIFGVGAFAAYNYWEHLNFKSNTDQLTRDLAAYEQGVELKRTEFQTLVKAVAWDQDNRKKLAQISEVQKQQASLQETQAKLNQERNQIITSLRASVLNKPIPELALKDGRKLNQATITQANDSVITVSLPSGIVKITPADLTPEWRQRLHY
ncbi:hypothetical protein SAMN02745166_00543 [Prosthecobacter debontii]|uniref:Uncharacterized protein n=1 Tax=Prosthecobacter debontii TaxID=48467 RepID=A0A1T4WRB6_9BACT|nr:hypothetical protein [Prosthecobacter debontii]SKA79789.1 hypothetical protein SAMN02745166_00543 [Prosthecobacter debontii]